MYALQKRWETEETIAPFTDSGADAVQISDADDATIIVISCAAKYAFHRKQWKVIGKILSLHDHVEVQRHHNWFGEVTPRPYRMRPSWGHGRSRLLLDDEQDILESVDLAAKFDSLVTEWRTDNLLLSSMSKKLMHPAYLRIIGLGPSVLPLLLRELEQRPSYWFSALTAISGDDPVPDSASFDEAVQVWTEWGREKGLL
jgi:hypothetical protein